MANDFAFIHDKDGDPMQALMDNGWSFMTAGDNAYVFQSPDSGMVAKVDRNIATASAYAALAKANRGNPYFQDIHHTEIVRHGTPDDPLALHVTIMPMLLESHAVPGGSRTAAHLSALLGNRDFKIGEAEKSAFLNDPELMSAARQMMTMADEMNRRFGDILPAIDSNEKNVLFRQTPDGQQAVLADPFVGGDTGERGGEANYGRRNLGLPPLPTLREDGLRLREKFGRICNHTTIMFESMDAADIVAREMSDLAQRIHRAHASASPAPAGPVEEYATSHS